MKKGRSKFELIVTSHTQIWKDRPIQRKAWLGKHKTYLQLIHLTNSTNLISLFLNSQTMILRFKVKESTHDNLIKINFIFKNLSSTKILTIIKISKFIAEIRNFKIQILYIIKKKGKIKVLEELVLLIKKIEYKHHKNLWK